MRRIVVLGGGYTAMSAASHQVGRLRWRDDVRITVVNASARFHRTATAPRIPSDTNRRPNNAASSPEPRPATPSLTGTRDRAVKNNTSMSTPQQWSKN
ncbi:hypothetical protein [Amycolatopsis albispora]|uniref:hypothetical protein n=1 Tax=Amycolatopsis albispora TaxID=1804986 RepID=UPI0013B39D6F|nr:hypothetical protein [Amycolatopsis albispora]